MKTNSWFKHALCGLAVLVSLSVQAWADPPSRVGRVSYISGSVSFRPGTLDEWGDASVNYPLTTGDQIWTDDDSRAEIHVGSTAMRLGEHSDFDFLNLDDGTTQIRLSQGSLNLRVHQLGESDVLEIDTPNSSISILRPGSYRIDVDPSGDGTRVTVRSGESEVTAEGSAFPVYADQSGIVSGIDIPSYDIQSAGGSDSLDDWAYSRDQREDHIASLKYVSRETIGYEDLDQYGYWRVYPGYGAVWVPTSGIASGWSPYRYGHWAWVEPWGWTWVDQAPWGFAPFHYGRWAVIDGTWAWLPGQVVARPVYAPALVAFIGGGAFHLSLGFGAGGGVAWFPLGPGELYAPAYRVSPAYVRNVNVTNVNIRNVNVTNYNVTNVTNVTYVNQTVPGAVTAVPQNVFVGGRSVGNAAVVVPTGAASAAKVVAMTAPVPPKKESVLAQAAVSTGHVSAKPPVSALQRAVLVRTAPPVRPVSFAAREKLLATANGRPLDTAALANLSKSTPPSRPLVIKSAAQPGEKSAAHNGLRPARTGITETHSASTALTPGRSVARPTQRADVEVQARKKETSKVVKTDRKLPATKPSDKTEAANVRTDKKVTSKPENHVESKQPAGNKKVKAKEGTNKSDN